MREGRPGRKLRVLLVGLFPPEAEPSVSLALGSLKAYADSRPGLSGQVEISLLHETTTSERSVGRAVVERRPDLVGFCCYVWNMEAVLRLCPRLKSMRPLSIVLGGHEVSTRPREILESCPAADFVAVGEGEETFAELLERLSRGQGTGGVRGLAWRGPAGPVVEEPRPPIADLCRLPSPYLSGAFGALGPCTTVRLELARGCPFKCRYCPGWRSGGVLRRFPLERFERELEAVPPSVRFIELVDADLCLNPRRAAEILERLGPRLSRRPEVQVAFTTYLGGWSAGLAAKAAATGSLEISAGIQTINPKPLRSARRRFDRESNERILRLLAGQPRLSVVLDFILGLPDDTLEGYRRSLDWGLSMRGTLMNMAVLLLLPGSEFREAPGRYGIRYNPRPPYEVRETATMPEEDLKRARRISFWITYFQLDPVLRDALRRLGDRGRGSGGFPYLAAYERLGDIVGAANPRLAEAAGEFVCRDVFPCKELAGEARREACEALRELLASASAAVPAGRCS